MSSWVNVSTAASKGTAFSNATPFEEKSKLGKDDFLRILTAQLANQDPTNPLQDRDFIAQMATFSSLEQMTNLNSSFNNFAGRQISQYASSIGKEITWVSKTGGSETASGIVDGISFQDGFYYFTVDDQKIPMEYVTEIKESAAE